MNFFVYLCLYIYVTIIINFVYLCNIDLFLDIILLKKKRDKLIIHILNHYYIDEHDIIFYKK